MKQQLNQQNENHLTNDGNLGHRNILLLILVSVIVLVPGTFGVSLFDRDEGWYAQVAKEMVLSGNWLTPHYLGEIWLAKPPLLYWLIGASFKLFGIGTFQARLVPLLLSVINVLLVARLAAALFNRRIALYSSLIFITAGLPAIVGKMVLTDSLLLTCILLAVLSHWQIANKSCTLNRTILFGVAIGMGILAKGPAIILFAGGFALALLFTKQKRHWLTTPKFYLSIPAALIIAAPWYLYIWQVAGPRLTNQFVGFEILSRITGTPHGHTGPPGYHLLIAIVGLLPWTGLAFLGVKYAFKHRKQNDRNIVLLIWWALPWLILELIRSKLPHYTLPCYVPLAILSALLLNLALEQKPSTNKTTQKIKHLLARGSLFLAVLGGIGVLIALFTLPAPIRLPATFCALIVFVGFAIAARLARISTQKNLTAMLATTAALYTAIGFFLLPALEPLRLNHQLADRLNKLHQPGEQIYLVDYEEPSVFFYLHTSARTIHHAELKNLLHAPATRPSKTQPGKSILLVIPQNKWSKLTTPIKKQLHSDNPLAKITGTNVARMEKQTIHVIRWQRSANPATKPTP